MLLTFNFAVVLFFAFERCYAALCITAFVGLALAFLHTRTQRSAKEDRFFFFFFFCQRQRQQWRRARSLKGAVTERLLG